MSIYTQSRGNYMAEILLEEHGALLKEGSFHHVEEQVPRIVTTASSNRPYWKIEIPFLRQEVRISRRFRRRFSRPKNTDIQCIESPRSPITSILACDDDVTNGNICVDKRPQSSLNKNTTTRRQTVIEMLITDEKNKPLWDLFLKNRFCQDGYRMKSRDFNNKFRKYSKQDYFYLLDYIRFKSFREFKNPEVIQNYVRLATASDRIAKDVQFAKCWYERCLDMGATEAEMDTIQPSHAAIAYSNWIQLNALMNDYISAFIMMIPCIYGWYQIAKQLEEQDIRPDETSFFYKHWYKTTIEEGATYANGLSATIELLRDRYNFQENSREWSRLLREACQMEIALFNVAYED